MRGTGFIWQRLRNWRARHDDFLPCRTPWWEDALGGSCDNGKVPVGPRNTYSNLAYAACGLFLYWLHGTPESLVMAASLGFLCLGSMAYHAVPGRFTAALDHAGMYATFLALATYAAGGTWIPMLAAAVGGALVFQLLVRADLNAMMGVFLWIAGVAAWHRGTYWLLFLSATGFVAAMCFWLLDKRRELVGRWGHAAWHIGTSISISCMYLAQRP